MNRKTILIIDDAEDICMLQHKILENGGFEVECASNFDQAIKSLKSKVPHLILLDLHMGEGKSGFDFLKLRRVSNVLKNVPLIVVSGCNDKKSVFKALSFGADDFMLKPIQAQQLLNRVRKSLGKQEHLEIVFKDELPKLKVIIPARMHKVSETAIQVTAPVKLSQLSSVCVNHELFSNSALNNVLWNAEYNSSSIGAAGTYRSKLNGIGLKKNLKKTIKERQKI